MANAKLNRRAADEIRARIAGGERIRPLADEYGVAPSTIRAVRDGDTWTDSPEDLNAVPPPTAGWGPIPRAEKLERIYAEVQACCRLNAADA